MFLHGIAITAAKLGLGMSIVHLVGIWRDIVNNSCTYVYRSGKGNFDPKEKNNSD